MGITRLLRRTLKAGIFLGLFTIAMVYGWTHYLTYPEQDKLQKTNTIICLAAGLKPDGSMGFYTHHRALTCVDLYKQGLAPQLAFTGGNSSHDAPATGQQMAQLAIDLGVPAAAIVIEDQSESTLQNALFTLNKLPNTAGVILVTDKFHLPRSLASFYWAGARDIQPYPSFVGSNTIQPRLTQITAVEALKIWVNLVRAQVYSLAGMLGIPDSQRIQILE